MPGKILSVATMLTALTALTAIGCDNRAIEWDEAEPLPATLSASARHAFDAQNRLVATAPPAVAEPIFTNQCAGSVRVAHDTTGDWYAVWWSVRQDSTADLVVSRSLDGVRWLPAVIVDSLDRGKTGCRRPPPAIDADGGNVHVAYAMAAVEGPGIFASHSMDRGTLFHSPVAVAYGERLGHSAIAARGNLVAVTYEDPNSAQPRIGLALSRTMAHLFQSRETVSGSRPARVPGVAVGDGLIAVTWAQGSALDASAPRILRIGQLR